MPYKKHFLTNVILRVDFVSPEETIKQTLLPDVKNTCVSYFPIPEERKVETQQVLVNNQPSMQNTVISKENLIEWHFFGTEREKELCITHQCMFVDFKEYKTYDDFKAQYFDILEKLMSSYPTLKINRVGLRYIDKIVLQGDKNARKSWGTYWNRYLNSNLVQGLSFADDDNSISRNMGSLEMNYGDHMLRFQYGVYNEDYPAPNKKNEFVLDTDIFSTGIFGIDEIQEMTDKFHAKAKDWFEKSIKAPLREKMGVVD